MTVTTVVPVEPVEPAAMGSMASKSERQRAAGRLQLAALASRVGPVAPAHLRSLPIAAPLGELLPGAALARGATVVVDGPLASALSLALLAAASAGGEWVAVAEPDDRPGDFGALAAAEAGVALERCAVVRRVARDRWPVVVNALLEGARLVVAPVPQRLRHTDARRLVARARERQCILVVLGSGWPAEAALRIHGQASRWHGLEAGEGLLMHRELLIEIDSKQGHRRSWCAQAS